MMHARPAGLRYCAVHHMQAGLVWSALLIFLLVCYNVLAGYQLNFLMGHGALLIRWHAPHSAHPWQPCKTPKGTLAC